MCSKKKKRVIFYYSRRILIYPSIIYFVPFKVIAFRYKAVVSALCPTLETLLILTTLSSSRDALFFSLACPFVGPFGFGKGKSRWGPNDAHQNAATLYILEACKHSKTKKTRKFQDRIHAAHEI